jgi:hypothetical protein
MFFNPTLAAIASRRGFFDAVLGCKIGLLWFYVNRIIYRMGIEQKNNPAQQSGVMDTD